MDLYKLRKKKGLKQSDVSKKSDISRQTYYSMIENGRRTPSVKLAKKIADVLGFNWIEFYEK